MHVLPRLFRHIAGGLLRRLLMTTSVIVVVLYSGHALFAVSGSTASEQALSTAETRMPQHLQLKERSARGLAETGIIS